jgi:hypothetical protein
MRKTFFSPADRQEIVARLRRLSPDTPRRCGRMTAPQMVAHLRDQMAHCLGDRPCTPVRSLLRWAPLRYASIYWVPWPRGRLKGPPDAFVTRPASWPSDLAHLLELVARFGTRDPGGSWPAHAILGRMRGVDWGCFCYKHFDHHLRQFGQ